MGPEFDYIANVSASTGRSMYPTPAHALAQALGRDANAELEIHLRADDDQAPVAVRSGLLKLRDAGVSQARHTYELTARQITETRLTAEELDALKGYTPYLGTSAVELERLDEDTFALELVVAVQGA